MVSLFRLVYTSRVCIQNKKLYEDILASEDQFNVGWKMVFNFLGKGEKNTEKSLLSFP